MREKKEKINSTRLLKDLKIFWNCAKEKQLMLVKSQIRIF